MPAKIKNTVRRFIDWSTKCLVSTLSTYEAIIKQYRLKNGYDTRANMHVNTGSSRYPARTRR